MKANDMDFLELDYVETKTEKDGVKPGQRGTIVHIFTNPSIAYLVEFTDTNGHATAMPTYQPEDLTLIKRA